jgi:hypothetical protein
MPSFITSPVPLSERRCGLKDERKKRGISAPDFILQQAQELYTKADKLLSAIPPPKTGLEQFLL